MDNQVDFIKTYTNNHQHGWTYWGLANNNKIEGKWGESKTSAQGEFEL